MLKEKHAPKNSDFYFKNQFHAFASSKLDCSSLSYKKIRATIDQAIIQKKCSSTHSGYERCRSDQFSSAQCVKLRRRTPSGLCKPVGLCFFPPTRPASHLQGIIIIKKFSVPESSFFTSPFHNFRLFLNLFWPNMAFVYIILYAYYSRIKTKFDMHNLYNVYNVAA